MFINYWFEVIDSDQQLSEVSSGYDVIVILYDPEREAEDVGGLEASLAPMIPRVLVSMEPTSKTASANYDPKIDLSSHLTLNNIPVYHFDPKFSLINELICQVVRNPEVFMHSRPRRKEWFWGITTVIAASGTIALCILTVSSFRLKHGRGSFLSRFS